MGDDCCTNMGPIMNMIKETIPDVYIHSIMLGNSTKEDVQASFRGNVNDQIQQACTLLRNDTKLASGFYGLGFSQGGLFLRAVLQRCTDLDMKRLITIGAPHRGVSEAPVFKGNNTIAKISKGSINYFVYTSVVQRRIVQAQYFNNPKKQEDYKKYNKFLPDINNEVSVRNTID
ncbi:hypothetical protein BB560_001061 [Smittium megazygosporum]|uniref:Palmitoyl-protein thioesterase 1 n=1 Tax=Smittium megazygosporum TaxID=133381 RepID=A0A2T9ZIN1_9FUNG|nr:hypothetical protein BB560_001061 [Smittium megazygosporum]